MTSFSGVTFILFCFVTFILFYAFVEAAALCSIVHRYASAPIATRVFYYLFGEMSLFPSIFLYHFRFIFVWRVRRTFFPSEWCFFYLVTTCWVFDISLLCENPIIQFNQSMDSSYQNNQYNNEEVLFLVRTDA